MRPVDNLIRAARQVAEGNFSSTIPVTSKDEIGELASEFNNMASQLRESYENLEQRVTERTEELRESEERYRNLFEGSSDAIFVSSQGRILAANKACLELFGFTHEDAIGSDVGERYAEPADREQFHQEISVKGSVQDFEVRLLKKDGTVMDCLLTASLQTTEMEEGSEEIQGLVRDVTERKRAEETLVQQMRDLAVLEERNRMAREIHDTLAQGFTGIVIQMEEAEQAAEESPSEVGDHLSRAKSLARESLQEARRSVWNLLPQILEGRTLEAALEEEVRRVSSNSQKAGFSQSGIRRDLSHVAQAAIIRVCQESLTNAQRHSGASEISVSLAYSPDTVSITIQDNGQGFDVVRARGLGPDSGFGLKGMEQRAQLLGGKCEITSQAGRGTAVQVEIPG